jgi:hypothetical protein
MKTDCIFLARVDTKATSKDRREGSAKDVLDLFVRDYAVTEDDGIFHVWEVLSLFGPKRKEKKVILVAPKKFQQFFFQ